MSELKGDHVKPPAAAPAPGLGVPSMGAQVFAGLAGRPLTAELCGGMLLPGPRALKPVTAVEPKGAG